MKDQTLIVASDMSNKIRLVQALFIPFIAIGFFLPIAFLIRIEESRTIVFALPTCIFWGTSFYLLKYLLWNVHGKELIEVYADEIRIRFDYKYFVDGGKRITVVDNSVDVILTKCPNNEIYKLSVSSGDDSFSSSLNLSKKKASKLAKDLVSTCDALQIHTTIIENEQ